MSGTPAEVVSKRNPIIDKLFGKIIDRAIEKDSKNVHQLKQSLMASLTDEQEGFRRITGERTRDLTPIKQSRMIKIADYLWKRNPIAKRFIELVKGYVIGKDSKVTAKHEDSQEVIDKFQQLNHWDIIQSKRTRELRLFGEICIPVWVKPDTGEIRLGYIDPDSIDSIEVNPINTEIVTAVVLKKKVGGKKITLPVIREQTDPTGENLGLLVGAQENVGTKDPIGCLYFRANDLSDARRGLSDLLPIADWLDALDVMIFNLADREGYLNAFIFDVEVDTDDEAFLKERRKEIKNNPPKSGAVILHTPKEKWNVLTPNLTGRSATDAAKLVFAMIVAGTGMPEHWLGMGGGVNRATALEMGQPTLKMLSEIQDQMKNIFETIHLLAIDQSIIAGNLLPSSDEEREEMRQVEAHLPELTEDDVKTIAESLLQVTNSLIQGLSADLVKQEDASKVYTELLSRLGTPVDPVLEGDSVQASVKAYELITGAAKKVEDIMSKAAKA